MGYVIFEKKMKRPMEVDYRDAGINIHPSKQRERRYCQNTRQGLHYYFRNKFPDFPRYFQSNVTHFPPTFSDILIFLNQDAINSFDRHGIWESLQPTFGRSRLSTIQSWSSLDA